MPTKGLSKNKGGTDLGPVRKISDEEAREAALVMSGIAAGKKLRSKVRTMIAAAEVIEALLGVDYKEEHDLSKKDEEAHP